MDRVSVAIDQWRRERPELELLPMELTARLGAVSRHITHDYLEPFFRERGLQPREFDVLATLRRAGEPYALTPTQLFKVLMFSSGGMTNQLDRLEKAGLIARRPNPDDRRSMLVTLTEEGLELVNSTVALHVDNEARALSPLSDEEQRALNALLAKLMSGLDANG
ncbi:MarR family winged helix-turn-helix transcriptional regulator [Halomonas caseinilytica]|uniref:DNA-binding transcriptional regulator, MarR family n=2 Tax=Halomonas caseinilytica TaxID=438744 RepID=A0A1M6VCD1_9GAMM|nr:MarR family transcriptional regulator [Halomonas caseinilytica]SEN02886.1 DNA-binding transcriptional regulator, MarR family [Halomonas caseinilytica]SHK78946.1 DNA-binding transcriptional regulator, MarR family [Halomonas caseinilytica]